MKEFVRKQKIDFTMKLKIDAFNPLAYFNCRRVNRDAGEAENARNDFLSVDVLINKWS